jgi:tetratricopeptide (TPR) repeat protein
MEERLLQSWKEISKYLNCSLRTCHRWEENLDLPVHRLDGTPKARVFAYKDELDRWRAEKLGYIAPAEKTERSARRKKIAKFFLWPGAAIVLVVLGVIAWRLFNPGLLQIPDDKPSLAVVQFEKADGDDSLDAWRTALPDLIITDLAQSRFVTVAGITDIYRRLRDLKLVEAERFSAEDLRKVAKSANVRYVATGSLKRAGQDVTVSISVHNANTGETAKSIEAGFRNEEDVFAAADTLSKKIKSAIGLNSRYISRDIDKKVEDISTSSPRAFKLFSQGYRLSGIAKYQEAIPVLQKAVEADPKFALVYKNLYLPCLNSLREDDAKKYLRKAVDLAGRLSERERGQALILHYEMNEENPAKQLESLERLCRFYPDDWFGSQRLLSLYFGNEDWDKALPVAEQSWKVNKTNSNIAGGLCGQIVRCYENLGLSEKAEKFLSGLIKENPDNRFLTGLLEIQIDFSIHQNRSDAALAATERLIALYPNNFSYFKKKGIISLYRGDFEGAEREFRKVYSQGEPYNQLEAVLFLRDLNLAMGKVQEAKNQLHLHLKMVEQAEGEKGKNRPSIVSSTQKIYDHWDLAYLYRLTGQLPEALEEIDAALRDQEKLTSTTGFSGSPLEILRLKALIILDMNKSAEFENQAEKVKLLIEQGQNPRLMRIYYHLLGSSELKRNNIPGAVEYFSKAVDLVSVPGASSVPNGPDPQYFYSLAETYAQSPSDGIALRALPLYEKVTLPTVNRLHCGDLYAKSFYKMAKLHERACLFSIATVDDKKTSRTKAIENYRKFLSLWGNADPVFAAEVEDARKCLAALESK